jgi:stage V sporulation protein G
MRASLKHSPISGTKGYFVSMPSRRRPDGSHQDIAHPINSDMRKIIEQTVLDAYEQKLQNSQVRVSTDND